MPARLILNADDFGQTLGINRAVAELHDAGALTSATLMASGAAFDDAVEISRTRAALGVGCHVVLVDGTPTLHPAEIPTLLGTDGKTFRPSLLDFHLAVLRGKVSADEIVLEALAQIQKLQRAGIDVTHLDTHKHVHMLPQVARALLFAAERAGVGAMRCPFEPAWSVQSSHPPLVRRFEVGGLRRLRSRFMALEPIRSGKVATTDGALGIAATGSLNQHSLGAVLDALPAEGTFELVLHPGYNDAELNGVRTRLRASREIERTALLQTFGGDKAHPSAPELIHYGKLGQAGVLRELGQHVRLSGHEPLP